MNLKFLLIFLFANSLFAQEKITGFVKEKSETGINKPLIGANIIRKGTVIGTSSGNDGSFELPFSRESNILLISFIGYKSETIVIDNQRELEIILLPEAKTINDIEIIGSQSSSYQNYSDTENTTIITKKELQKAACCTLAESFETNPSIDVSFSDAITGVRQIEMLGLAGIYTQTTMEALPYIRGLMSNVGLNFVPGTWINAINVSKGIGSVSNGFESITGQIDIDMQKPFDEEENNPGFLNLYGDNEQRFESNFNYRYTINENLSSMTLLHASTRKHSKDINGDLFMDMPNFETINVMQRWQYFSFDGWESQIGFQYVNEKKEGGTLHSDNALLHSYKFGSANKLFNIYGKTGYINPEDETNSFGLQWSFTNYSNSSHFGSKNYFGKEKNLYLNFIYQANLGNESNKLRTGISLSNSDFEESLNNVSYNRVEKIPGAFLEYSFKPNDEFSVVAGLRGDYHNYFGFFMTPRVHVRYSPDPDLVLRGVVGSGFRTSNIFVEYASSFASSRLINIDKINNFGYGLEQESAWNYGLNLTYYFLYQYRDATLSFDFYRTQFDNSIVADLDSNPQQINFKSVTNGAYSNTFQLELNLEPFMFFNTRIAYRFIESQQVINGAWTEKPFNSKHRIMLNLAYASGKTELNDSQMLYDLTIQWFGQKRIPSTEMNPIGLRTISISPDFFLINAQITRSFNKLFDFYLGVENLLDFKQNNPIIDPTNPNGNYFDASLIWGPINGRMVYAGLRYKI